MGWEARIVRPPQSAPYLHVAGFALTADSGQFGAGVTAAMGPDGAFAALVEYVVDRHVQPGSGLFASRRWPPRLRVGDFSPTGSRCSTTRPPWRPALLHRRRPPVLPLRRDLPRASASR